MKAFIKKEGKKEKKKEKKRIIAAIAEVIILLICTRLYIITSTHIFILSIRGEKPKETIKPADRGN